MNEFFASQRLSAYIDGELSAAEMAEVERALRENPELRAEYERLQGTVDFLREHGPARAPMGFHDKVMAAVEDEPMPGGVLAKIRGWFSSMPVETFAVALAAVLVAVVVGQKLDDRPETAPSVEEGSLAEAKKDTTPSPEATRAEPRNADGDLGAAVSTDNDEPSKKGSKDAPAWAEEMAGVIVQDEQPQKRVSSITEPEAETEDAVVMLEVDETEPPVTSASSKDMPGTEIDDGSTAAQLQAAAAYQLDVQDPESLRSLLMLIDRYGGTATSNGRPVNEDALLEGASRVGISIMMPQQNVTAFYKGLGQLGMVTVTSQNAAAPLYGSDRQVGIYVDVTQ